MEAINRFKTMGNRMRKLIITSVYTIIAGIVIVSFTACATHHHGHKAHRYGYAPHHYHRYVSPPKHKRVAAPQNQYHKNTLPTYKKSTKSTPSNRTIIQGTKSTNTIPSAPPKPPVQNKPKY